MDNRDGAIPPRPFRKALQVELIVRAGKEAGQSVVASLNEVMGYPTRFDACSSGHLHSSFLAKIQNQAPSVAAGASMREFGRFEIADGFPRKFTSYGAISGANGSTHQIST